MNINKVILVGKVISDVISSITENNSPMVRFTLATNRFFKGKDGENKTETCYHNMIAWDSVAETIEKYVKKGDELGIEGRINNKSVKQPDGSYKNYNQIVVEEFFFGDKKKEPIKDKKIDEAIEEAIEDIPF